MNTVPVTEAPIQQRVRELAETRGDRVAVIGPSSRLTYRELDRLADQAATDLARSGIGPGDRVAWLGANDLAYVVTMLAVRRRGACLIGLNWREVPESLRLVCAAVTPAVLVADATSAQVAEQLTGVVGRTVIANSNALPWRDVPADPAAILTPDPNADAAVFFTSGSTGRPKAVAHTYEHVDAAMRRTMYPDAAADGVYLIIPPVFHVAGATWVVQGMLNGGTLVFGEPGASILRRIAHTGVTHALMVPALIESLLAEQAQTGLRMPTLRLIAYGTSPISPSLLGRALVEFGCRFAQMYGSTEAGGIVCVLQPEDHVLDGPHRHRQLSTGRPVPGARVKVVDPETGHDRPVGTAGELVLQVPWGMRCYLDDPQATARVMDSDGWVRTNDAAHLDADGYVYVSGRLDDVIISGGENVHPGEVENALAAMPGTAAATLVGVPDDRWGERIVVAVIRSDEAEVTEQQIIGYCRERLAGYKCPRQVVFLDDLPRTSTGKVQRRSVRGLVVAALGG